ncbi:MAG: hypothetical protein KF858_05780, partial [Candidatus Sumerlaeia bacterium]|nr:hypothetical protein [Candidatus Sumerlaeia bacterium]
GWSSRRKVPVDDPELGMKMILKRLGMDRTYYSFDHKGWHFFVLDSLFEIETSSGPSYEPRIGEEQLHWLALDLAAAGDRPKVGVVHIAAFCNMGQIGGDPEAKAMNHMVVRDNKDLREVLERHRVTALLQGHSHQIEDFYYGGVHYITSPSVSAAWWGGNWRGFEPGYTILNAHADGRLTWHRTTFPWEHQLEPEDTLERQRIAEREAFEAEQKRLREAERAAARGLAPV